MPRTFAADSSADPQEAWAMLSEPARWNEWSPYLHGAWGLGEPEVQAGRLGAARLLWVLPVPARIVDKQAGRSWTWRVGPAVLEHAVTPRPGGCRVSVTIEAPGPLEPLLAATYGPVVGLLVSRLARLAASRSTATSSSG
jgi:polyketide cyclase/dehydrase/lipid transport protein